MGEPEQGARDISRERTIAYCLTAAEHETMRLVARGLTNREIAEVLGISLNTVRNRLATCFAKLSVSRRSEAVLFLLEQ
jgi:DNA-binding CsgD family transcriptional regulator